MTAQERRVAKAAAYTRKHLASIGVDERFALRFWQDHVAGSFGEVPKHSGDAAIVSLVKGIQLFVYGNDGDAAMGVPAQAATASEVDGKLGPATSRRMLTYLDWLDEDEAPVAVPTTTSDDCLLVNGERLPVGGGVQIVSLDEEDGRWSLEKHSSLWRSRKPTMLGFGHWDVCTSAAKCHAVLNARELSSSGCFDNPGPDGKSALYQFLDPGKRRGRHGGGKANRAAMFSFDLSNAVNVKYAGRYLKKTGIARPVIHMDKRERLGKGTRFLGMYAGQIHSLLYTLKALAEYSGNPLVFPVHADGSTVGRNFKGLFDGGFKGVATHRHLPKTSKWDIRGAELQVVMMLREGRLPLDDFPSLVESFRIHDSHWDAVADKFAETCTWPELGIGVTA